MYSVLTKMRYKKQNWMQGQHNGKMVDLFNWPKFRQTKLVFFRTVQGQGYKPRHPCVLAHE